MYRENAANALAVAGQATRHMEQDARDVASVLNRTAQALEQSANLAEERARRTARAGRLRSAKEERLIASRARDASERARAQAKRFLALSGDPTLT